MKYSSLILALGLAACGSFGRRPSETRVVRPSEVTDFGVLYSQNCSGCHGVEGKGGLTAPLGSPVYLAIADNATIRRVVELGRAGTTMPPFGQNAGGLLTEAQIDVIVSGIREHWANPGTLGNDKPPEYVSSKPGNTVHGHEVYTTFCSSCHGWDGRGGQAGSLVNSSYLALVSDQHLRTVIITGMPALGAPDWRSDVPGKVMTDADVTDVVAWLTAHRQPLPAQVTNSGGSE
jgi:cytochrome c oxidase cbb3-type subunit 3